MTPAANSSVDQAFDVLALISASIEPVGVTQLARDLGVPTSTAHRVIATLEGAGYLSRDTTGSKYQLGLGAQEMAHALLRRFPLESASLPCLTKLAASTGETAVLCARIGFYRLRLASAEGTNDVHAAPRLGQTARLEETAGGRVILAFLDDDLRRRYMRWRGKRGKPAARTLEEKLEAIRKRGYLLDDYDDGHSDLALPVQDDEGRVVASLVLEAAETKGGARGAKARMKRVRDAAGELERLMQERPALAADPFAHIPPEELSPGFDPTPS